MVKKTDDEQEVISQKDLWWSMKALIDDMKFNASKMREIMASNPQMLEHASQLEGAAEIAESWVEVIGKAE